MIADFVLNHTDIREAIAKYIGTVQGHAVSPSEVVLTSEVTPNGVRVSATVKMEVRR